ncbi:uncharacterized protein [Misgurnus anguillicaudatus]|uniref:uncharacterized protein n=1 Tax=Misgurnus anguillicaudatus TaxID=75329 RepID=UPI003CCFB595
MNVFKVVIAAALLLTSEGLLVQGPSHPLVAQLGRSLILPCYVETPLALDELEVEWKRTDEQILVHLFQNGEVRPESQYQSYRGRVHFVSDQISKGNFSIVLENITVADTGIYECVVYSHKDVGKISAQIQRVERVVVTGDHNVVFAYVGEEIVLNCMVDSTISPHHFEEVSWKKIDRMSDTVLVLLFQNGTPFPESSHMHYRDRVEFFTEEIPKGNFSVKLKNVQTSDKGEYMCEVHTEYSVTSGTVTIGRLGMSTLHMITLMLCFSSLLLTFVLSFPVTIYISRKDTSTRTMYIHYFQVVCPNICLFIAFCLWGVIEGSVVEVVMCATINVTRIILLLLMAPYFHWNKLISVDAGSIQKMIEFTSIPIAYFFIATAFCSVVLHDLWNSSEWTNAVPWSVGVILLSFFPAFFQALINVCFTQFFEVKFSLHFILRSLGHVLMQTSNIIQMRLFFHRSPSSDESMITTTNVFGGVSFAISCIILPIPVIRQFVCAKLNDRQLHKLIWRCYLIWVNVMVITLVGHSAFIMYSLNTILEYSKERIGWICVALLQHILTAIAPGRFSGAFPDVIYTVLFMYGAACLPMVNSVSLATELILQVYKGERTMHDLRVVVLPFESVMYGVWLILQIYAYWKFSLKDIKEELNVLRDTVADCTPQLAQIENAGGADRLRANTLTETRRRRPEALPFLSQHELDTRV